MQSQVLYAFKLCSPLEKHIMPARYRASVHIMHLWELISFEFNMWLIQQDIVATMQPDNQIIYSGNYCF